jgi:hypothetical protein
MKDLHQFTVLKVGERELYRETCMYLVRQAQFVYIFAVLRVLASST